MSDMQAETREATLTKYEFWFLHYFSDWMMSSWVYQQVLTIIQSSFDFADSDVHLLLELTNKLYFHAFSHITIKTAWNATNTHF